MTLPQSTSDSPHGGNDDFSFSAFARQPFYQAENRRLIDLVGLQPGQRVIDLACGPGLVTQLVLEKVRDAKDAWILGVDLSTQALNEARRAFTNVEGAVVEFVHARAEELSDVISDRVDAIVFCNAIHLVDSKEDVLNGIAAALKPGGSFAFNSTFYSGSIVPETEPFYRRWMMRALRLLKSTHGLSPDKTKVVARQQLTADEYKDLLGRAGFVVKRERVNAIEVPIEGWLDICAFSDFVAGALPGIQLETASSVLREAIRDTFREMELTFVPRNWLEVVAVRS